MVTKIYALVWLALVAAASGFYFTGNFNELTMVVLGFALSTVVAVGLVLVLRWWVDRRYSWKY